MFCLGFTEIKMEKEMTLQDFKTNIHKASESCQQVLQQSHDQVQEYFNLLVLLNIHATQLAAESM